MCVCNQGYEKDENEDCAGQFSFNNPLLHAFYKKAAIAFSLENSNDSGGSVCGGGGWWCERRILSPCSFMPNNSLAPPSGKS